MANVVTRLKAAWLAFRHAKTGPAFAVIYDSYEGLNREDNDPLETYYESFGSPEQAARFFNEAYPKRERDMGATEPQTERLVMILGPIDAYH